LWEKFIHKIDDEPEPVIDLPGGFLDGINLAVNGIYLHCSG
jgi:hypothetical protein